MNIAIMGVITESYLLGDYNAQGYFCNIFSESYCSSFFFVVEGGS
jgi:hypothetical protein